MQQDDDTAKRAVETARYIGGMAKELKTLASKADLGFLAYLLAMVEDDAIATIRKFNAGS